MSSWVKVGSERKLATNIWNDGKPCRRLIFQWRKRRHIYRVGAAYTVAAQVFL